jgi:hypothetical protein
VRSCCFSLEEELAKAHALTVESLRKAAATATQDVLDIYRRHEEAAPGSVHLRDFACTLILVVLRGPKLLMLQVGDGAVVVRRPDGLQCLSPMLEREYVNEAVFLVTPSGVETAFTLEMDATDIHEVAVMSDGVQLVGVDHRTNSPFEGLFDPLFTYACSSLDTTQEERDAALAKFLDGEAINSETDDDKTLIVAVRPHEKGRLA